MPVQQAAALLGVDRTRIPNIESGRFGISAERVRTLAFNYGCPDTGLVDLLAEMAQERARGWWEEHRGLLLPALLDIAELEYHAAELTTSTTTHIPGLLQTEEHARAVFDTADPRLPGPDLTARLSLRLRRQEVLERDRPPLYESVVHEAALRMQFGGPKVARAQLEHILRQSERDRITVRVIPFAVSGFQAPDSRSPTWAPRCRSSTPCSSIPRMVRCCWTPTCNCAAIAACWSVCAHSRCPSRNRATSSDP